MSCKYRRLSLERERRGMKWEPCGKIMTLHRRSHLLSSPPDRSRLDCDSCNLTHKRLTYESKLQFMHLELKYSLVNNQNTGIQCFELPLPGTENLDTKSFGTVLFWWSYKVGSGEPWRAAPGHHRTSWATTPISYEFTSPGTWTFTSFTFNVFVLRMCEMDKDKFWSLGDHLFSVSCESTCWMCHTLG